MEVNMAKDERLERISKASLRLVSIVDKEFNLSDKELNLVVNGIWNGINKVLDRRYKEVKNRHMIHPDREY
jgi:hypothetical protein